VRVFFIVLLSLPVLFLASCSHLKQASSVDWLDPHHTDRILATDPATLTEQQFYECEFAILAGYSGSGGNFLEEPHIAWLRKTEAAFGERGIQLEDKYDRGFAIADSYFNYGKYQKALREFRAISNQAGVELAEWFIKNIALGYGGNVKIVEYDGEIPWRSSETARAEDARYLFVAYLKGPVYRYDKLTKKHALIYAPKDKYDWCNKLEVEGNKVIIHLRDDAGTYAFNNERNEIRSICNVLREVRKSGQTAEGIKYDKVIQVKIP